MTVLECVDANYTAVNDLENAAAVLYEIDRYFDDADERDFLKYYADQILSLLNIVSGFIHQSKNTLEEVNARYDNERTQATQS